MMQIVRVLRRLSVVGCQLSVICELPPVRDLPDNRQLTTDNAFCDPRTIRSMECPKCGFEGMRGATECERCGVVFAKADRAPVRAIRPVAYEEERVADGRM